MRGDYLDINLLTAIRSASLELLWGKASSTVSNNLYSVKYCSHDAEPIWCRR